MTNSKMARIFFRNPKIVEPIDLRIDCAFVSFQDGGMFVIQKIVALRSALWMFLTVIGLALTSCTTMEVAVIDGGRMSNGQIGYNGYQIEVPQGYLSIDDPSLFDVDFTFARAFLQEIEGNYGYVSLMRDAHAFYSRDTEQMILIQVSEIRGMIQNPYSTLGRQSIDRWGALAREYLFADVVGTMEQVESSGKAAFVKTGIDPDLGFGFCGAHVYGQYNENFFIVGFAPDGDVGSIKRDVYLTIASLTL